jgi:rhodanese-related sulfurtransferase
VPDIATRLQQARADIVRISADELAERLTDGAWAIDIRPGDRREAAGHVPGAVVVDRLVLEWRLDPSCPNRMQPGPEISDEVYVICNEGYSSSLAARDLQSLGFSRAGDLIDGFDGWRRAGLPVDAEPTRYVR